MQGQRTYTFGLLLLVLVTTAAVWFSGPPARAQSSEASLSGGPTPAACFIYAVDQRGDSKAQLFTVNLRSRMTTALGPVAGYDIEGIAVHPVTHVLYATSSEHSRPRSQLFTVDSQTGALTPIGATGFEDIADLAFRPSDATLWAWAEGQGLVRIDITTGKGTLIYATTRKMKGLAWSNDGTRLYTTSGKQLWVYNPDDNTLKQIASDLPGSTTSLEMRPDGLLLGGVDREDSVDIFAYHIAASRLVMNVRIASSYDPDDIAWPAACGNASPGGEAKLIKQVVVEKRQVCPGEDLLVTVQAEHPESPRGTVDVFINGQWGSSQYLQFTGLPGKRFVQVVATTPEKYIDSRTLELSLVECDASRAFPVVYIRPNPYHPYVVDFEITNVPELQLQNAIYDWEFGDGQTAQTTVPFVSHDYSASLDINQPNMLFQAMLIVHQDGRMDMVAHKTVAVWNLYAFNKQHGFVQPRVTSSGRMQLVGADLVGEYTIENLEDEPIQLTSRQLEYEFCDPDLHAIRIEPQSQSSEVGGKQTITQRISLPADSLSADFCGLALYLNGRTSKDLPVYADVYFQLRDNPLMIKPVDDPATTGVLNQIIDQKLLGDGEIDRITDEDLYRLEREGKINFPSRPASASLSATDAGLQADPASDILGQLCQKGDMSPWPGVSCQVTKEWTYSPAYIFNAQKGDILLVAACSVIGNLLRQLSPPQHYSHEAIMTRDRYELRHSTAADDRYAAYPVGSILGRPAPTNGIRPDIMKWGWPGTITQEVYKAFEGEYFNDPESGVPYLIQALSSEPTKCKDDVLPYPPLVVKPPPDKETAEVRSKLHAAADAALAIHGHYRFGAYSEGSMALDSNRNAPPQAGWADGTSATVSSVFIWAALRKANLTLEGDELEPQDVRNGAEKDDRTADGLYLYRELERREASQWLYSQTYNQVLEEFDKKTFAGIPIGAISAFLSDAANDVANQTTNCFVSDWCDTAAKDSKRWRNPGEGHTVSPDNFFFWDTPPVGVYGYWEPIQYQVGEYQRVYRWLPSPGSGTVIGRVFYNGAPVANALVTLAPRETTTDANGTFTFPAQAAGTYEVEASKEVGPGRLATDKREVKVVAGATSTVDLHLNFASPPQPRVTIHTVIERVYAYGCWGTWIDPPFVPGWCQFPEDPDFYAVVNIDGREFENENSYIGDRGDISPNWDFSSQVDPSKANIPVSITIKDEDGFLRFKDDTADIYPKKGRTLNLLLDLNTCRVSGGAVGSCGVTISSQGGGDGHEDLAQIWFRIDVGVTPP